MPIECLECKSKAYKNLELCLINGKLEFLCLKCINKKRVVKRVNRCDICGRVINDNNLITTKVKNYYLCNECFLEVYYDGVRAGKC